MSAGASDMMSVVCLSYCTGSMGLSSDVKWGLSCGKINSVLSCDVNPFVCRGNISSPVMSAVVNQLTVGLSCDVSLCLGSRNASLDLPCIEQP